MISISILSTVKKKLLILIILHTGFLELINSLKLFGIVVCLWKIICRNWKGWFPSSSIALKEFTQKQNECKNLALFIYPAAHLPLKTINCTCRDILKLLRDRIAIRCVSWTNSHPYVNACIIISFQNKFNMSSLLSACALRGSHFGRWLWVGK